MTDIEKMFKNAVDYDTSDMYSSLSALHFEAYQKTLNAHNEKLKNYLWNINDKVTKSIIDTLKDNDLFPKGCHPKFGLSMIHKHTWFFFMEPEWFWGPEIGRASCRERV